MERRSIIPPNMSNKPRNGPISPRDHRDRDYNHQQPSHYSNNYNNSVNHHHSSHNSHHQNSSQQSHHHHSHHQSAPPPQQQQQQQSSYHPNSDLIHFVSSAWKEKIASDKTEYFKSESTEKYREFDFDSWINAKMRNSS